MPIIVRTLAALLLTALLAFLGFWWTGGASVAQTAISVKASPEDQPQFQRIYTATVGDGFRITIKLWSGRSGRLDMSEVTQKDGRWILFEARRVADKIIDRELYPLVQDTVTRILKMDAEFLATKPSEYTDTAGQTWRRK